MSLHALSEKMCGFLMQSSGCILSLFCSAPSFFWWKAISLQERGCPVGNSSSSFTSSFSNALTENSSSAMFSLLRASATMLLAPLTHANLEPNSSKRSRHRTTLSVLKCLHTRVLWSVNTSICCPRSKFRCSLRVSATLSGSLSVIVYRVCTGFNLPLWKAIGFPSCDTAAPNWQWLALA